MALSPEDAAFVCDQFGIDVDRPLITQVSRFDPWKDPRGVIDAYRVVHDEFPQVQLIPAWIDNVQRVMPKGEILPVPILCTVTFGAPVQVMAEESRREFMARAREAVLALRPQTS